jgi:nicotinamide riboside kinase
MEEKYRQEPSSILKVVLFGPESTGKTTLSEQLARHYNTVWVPEYAREYLQNKWNNERKTCEPSDLLPIAEGQMALENDLTKKATNILICDTDLLETKIYSEAYYVGDCDPTLEKHALENKYDLYLLTYIDIPWEADDLRDKPNERQQMFDYFKQTLLKYDRNFIILKGNKKERLNKAISHIDNLLKHMTDLTQKDIEQLEQKGISKEKVLNQIKTFKEGIPFVSLKNAAVVENGILKFTDEEEKNLIKLYESKLEDLDVLKFVPASGAASRMFKALFSFLDAYEYDKESLDAYLNRTNDKDIRKLANGLEQMPFYEKVMQRLPDSFSSDGEKVYRFVKEVLGEDALNYGFYPKGLLPFHKYADSTSTPFEEHLKEASLYASSDKKGKLHFTISEQHEEMFNSEFQNVKDRVSNETGTIYNVDYSFQKSSTDTIAVDMDNKPFRNSDGSILFRPGGHGALIENLNEQDADVIFIKNIDNVAVLNDAKLVADSKKVLAGVLLDVQEQAFKYAKLLASGAISDADIAKTGTFLVDSLNVKLPSGYDDLSSQEKIVLLKEKINRPIRICGMVKNEGEPGGGPFWIESPSGEISLQIIESAQIDMDNPEQKSIVQNATHFNPVDLVCGIRDYKGNKYNLLDFVDTKQGFITGKTKYGKELKALELPGLWNGAMAFWNTIFVEVPLVTFNPVKTVTDLLKDSHQA